MEKTGSRQEGKARLPGFSFDKILRQEEEYFNLPIKDIVVNEQVRTDIDENSEDFKALKESIREKGVLTPILVRRIGRTFHLVAGERRLRASRELGLPSIPARLLMGLAEDDGVEDIQLIENLQRTDLNPMDIAQAFLRLARRYDETIDGREFYNRLMLMQRDKNRVTEAFVTTVVTLEKISGKSLSILRNMASLLLLPDVVQEAVREGRVSLSNAYVLGEYNKHPKLMDVFEEILVTPCSRDALRKKFAGEGEGATKKRPKEKGPYARFSGSLKQLEKKLNKGIDQMKKDDILKLMATAEAIVNFLKKAASQK